MRARLASAAFLAAALAAAAGAFSGPTREVLPGTVDAGGGPAAASASYETVPSAAQTGTEAMAGAGYSLRAGHAERSARPRALTDLAHPEAFLSSMTLSWSVPAGDGQRGALLSGSSFYIQYGENATPAWSFASAQVKLSTDSLAPGLRVGRRVTGLTSNATYYFRVWHRDQDGRLSRLSNETTAHTLAQPVSAGAVYAVYATSVTVNWAERPAAPPQDSAEGYRLQASTAADFSGLVLSSATGGVNLSTLTVRNLAPDATYYFRVGSLNHGGAAHYASAGSTLTAAAQDIPPNSVQVVWVGLSSAALSWAPVKPTAYHVEASTASDFSGAGDSENTSANPLSVGLSLTGLNANTTYYLRAGALWGDTTFYAAASTRSTLAQPVQALAQTFLAVYPSSVTAAWAARPASPPTSSAEGYRLEASSAADFSGTVHSSVTYALSASTLSALSPALDPNTTYYFRVGALNHEGAASFAALGSTPTWAAALAPSVAAVFTGSVTVTWTPVDSQGYRLVACDAVDCSGAVFVSSTGVGGASGLSVEGLAADTTYHLRAGAYNHAGVAHMSVVFAATATLAAAVTPSFAAVYPASVTVSWTPAAAQGYEVRASTAADFTGTVHSSATPNGALGALTVAVPALDANTTYYFRLGALNHNSVPHFVVQAATPTAALAPSGLSPALLMIGVSSATLNWARRPDAPQAASAEGYLLEASASADFSAVAASSVTADLRVSTLTVNSPSLSGNTTYYFRVAALNHASVPGPFLALGSSATLAAQPTALAEPFPGVFPSSVSMAWAALAASQGYELEASTAADFSGTVVSSRTAVVAASTLTLSSPALDVNATYYFRVSALNHNGVPGPALALTTATAASEPGPGAPPVTAVSSFSVAAQWTAGTPANPAGTVYHLRASPTSDFSGVVRTSVTFGLSAVVSGLAPDTTYYLQAMALNRFGHPSYAALGSTITLTGQVQTLAVTFLGIFESSVTAAWAAGGGSGGYRLEASTAADFTGTLISSQTPAVAQSTLTVFSPALDSNTTYYLRVAARNSGGQAGVFTTLGSTSTLAAAPSALAVAFIGVHSSSVTAAWAARPSAPLAASNEGYRLDAATTADFSAVAASSRTASVLVSTLSVPSLGAHATYYFRVASLNHNGVPGPFLTLGSTPTLTEPLSDAGLSAVYNTSFTATWTVVPSSGYVLEASSTAFTSGITVSSLTYVPSNGSLSVEAPALWPNTVYSLRAGGRNHAGVENHSVFASSSTLADPAAGFAFAEVNRTSVTVNWLPLPTAAAAGSSRTSEGYVVEAATSADFGGPVLSSSTPNVSLSTLSITSLLAQTTYYFRVGTLNWDGAANYRFVGSTGNFTNPPDTPWFVRGYSGTMTGVATLNVPITPVTGQDRAFILAPAGQMSAGVGSVNGNQNANQVLVRAQFLTDSIVRLTRGNATNNSNYSFFVVDNPSASEIFVVSGSTQFAFASSQLNIPVSGITDFTRAVVFLTVASDQGNLTYYNQAHVRGALTSNTNLRLDRTGGNSGVEVDYFVVEFISPSWSVQTAEFTLNTGVDAAPQTQAISAVTPGNAFVHMTWSATSNSNDRGSAKVELFDATTLRFSRNAVATGSNVCRWYVLSHPNISVQRGSAATAAAGDLTVAQSFAAVDTSLSFLETTNDDSLDTATYPRPYWRATFTANNAMQWERFRNTSSANFRWQVVSLVSEIAPAAVTNLSALVGAQPGQVDLSWTSPGDDANSGTLSAGSQYRIHYTTDSATAETAGFFSTGSAQVLLSTVGVVPGSLRRYGLDGLWDNTTHFLRVWTRDEANIYSSLSNGATVATRARDLLSPAVLQVFPSSMTAGWDAFPTNQGSSNAAQGYLLEASSTNFGVLFPGGVLVSSLTRVMAQSTLTALSPALEPHTTYYLRAASLNHADERTYTVLAATATLPIAPTALAQTFLSVGLSSVTVAWAARPTAPATHTAAGYLLQASTAADFSGVPVSSETADVRVSTLSVLLPALENNTTYYFRVGTLGHSHAANFIFLGSTVTMARHPGSLGAFNTYLAVHPSSVTVAWTGFPLAAVHGASNSAQGFRLDASSTNFGAFLPGGVVYSSFTPTVLASTLTVESPALDPNTTYYFRVSALNHLSALTTLSLGATTTLALAPPSGANPFMYVHRTSVTVAWGALPPSPSSASSFGYRLEASTAADFTGTLVSSFTPSVLVSTLTVFNPALAVNTTYYFRVASLNHAAVPNYTVFGATSTHAAHPSAASVPFLGVFQTSVTAAWIALPEAPVTESAEGYQLHASSTDFGALAPGGGVTAASTTPNVLLSTLTVALPALQRNTTYYFKVFSLNHSGALCEGLVLGSTVTLPASPGALATTFLGVFQTSVTVAWAAMPASPQDESSYGYRLEASSTNFGALLPGGVTVSSSTYDRLVSTLTVRAPALDRDTTYYFRVSALNPGGHPGPFTVLGATATLTAALDAPTPLQIFESSSTWDWPAFTAPPGDLSAAGYLLEASQAADFSSGVSSTRTPVAALSALTVSAPALDANTTYYFRVAALNPNDVPVYAAVVSTSQRAVAPTPMAANATFTGVFAASVTARWTALPGAPLKDSSQGYQLEASSTDFDGTGDVPTVRSSVFSQNVLTVFAPALESNTTYYFRVAGRNHNGLPGAFAALYATSTMAGAPQAGADPILAVYPSSITAAWVSPPALPQAQSAQGFRLDASTAANFTGTLTSSQTFARTASTLTVSSPALSENTTYYLRVSALNHNGVPGAFTALGSTLTLLGSPTLIAPPFLAVYESSATVRWAAKPGGGYRVEASSTDFGALTPGGTTRSSQTFVAAASTLTVSALDADTTYYFRLAALNLAHDPGPFAVVGATATLAVAPGGTSPVFLAVNESSVTANWAAAPASPPSASAQGYRLDASLSADFSGAVVSSQTFVRTASALSVFSPALSANATYYFRVSALNHNGVPGTPLSLGATATLTAEVPGGSVYQAWPSSLTASWIDVAAQGYRLEASAAADFSGTLHSSQTSNVDITLLSVQTPALSVNTTYYLRVGPLNHNGVPHYGAAFSSPTLASPATAVAVSAAYFSSVTVAWTPQTASGFQLVASTSPDFGGTLRSSTSWVPSNNSLSVLNLLSGTTYYLRVAALNHAGAPHYSAAVSTKTGEAPKVWTGGGGDGDWFNDNNWSPPGAPTRNDSVTINLAAAVFAGAGSPPIAFSSMTLGSAAGGPAVSLRISSAIEAGTNILLNRDAGLTLDTTQVLTLTGDLTLRAGSSMTHTASPAVSTSAYASWDIGGIFNLEAGATVTLKGRGMPGGAPGTRGGGAGGGAGTGVANQAGGGGGHGGAGGTGEGPGGAGGAAYGSAADPVDVGSAGGGGAGAAGGSGGGLLRLDAGTIILDGLVDADGSAGQPSASGGGGGGSGGTIHLTAASISGSGELRAVGGAGSGGAGSEFGGGGAGGRLRAAAAGACTLQPSTFTVEGGSSGGSGAAGGAGTTSSPNLTGPTAFAGSVLSSTSISWAWSGGSGALSQQVLASTGGALSGALAGGAASYASVGLDPNTSYGAYARAAGCAHQAVSPTDTIVTLTKPLAGVALQGVHQTSVTFSWLELTPAEGAGYRLEASTTADFSGTVRSSQTLVVSLSTLTVFSLDPGSTYYFRLGGFNLALAANFAAAPSTVTLLTGPEPAAPAVTAVSSQSLAAQWSAGAPANPAQTAYLLTASTASDFTGTLKTSSTYAASALIGTLDPHTTYYLRVRAANHAGVPVVLSLASTSTWTADVGAPAAAAVYPSSITVSWTPVSARGYEVQASLTSDFSGAVHSTVTPNGGLGTLSVLSPALSLNSTYYLRVGGVAHSGARNYIDAGAAATLSNPASAPSVFRAFFTSVTVNWTPAVPAPSGYRLDASTASDFTGTLRSSSTPVGSLGSLSVLSLDSDSTYYLRVGALNHASVPNFTETVSTKTLNAPKVWVGTAGDHDWNNPANWSPSGVPARSNSVTVNTAEAVKSNLSVSFSSLTLGSPGGAVVSLTLTDGAGVADGGSLMIYGNSGLTVDTNQTITMTGNITMLSGSSMTHRPNAGVESSVLNLDIGGMFDLQSGAQVLAVGRGLAGGTANGGAGNGTGAGSGNAANGKGGGGGGFGGAGGQGENNGGAGGAAYGSAANPDGVGSSGGGGGDSTGSQGGAGGGHIHLVASAIALDGTLDASGGDGAVRPDGGGGGGSGGSIRLEAGTITGGGTLRADGGSGAGAAGSEYGGGGGGGRIYTNASGSCSLAVATASVKGGLSGDSGTGLPGQPGSAGTTYSANLTAGAAFSGASPSSTTITWSWTAGAGALEYQVLSATGGARSGTLSPATLSFTSEVLLPNTTYGAYVRDRGCAHQLDSAQDVVTTLARPVGALPEHYAGVFESSVSVGWGRLPDAPETDSAQAYLLEASTASDFTGIVFSSQTTVMSASTLTVTSLALNDTYYFRVATLNKDAVPNYTLLGSTKTSFIEVGVVISTPLLDIGQVDVNTTILISTSWIVTSLGNVSQTYRLSATTVTAGSPWVISAAPGTDAFSLQAGFNAAPPLAGDFGAEDLLTDSPAAANASRFAIGQSGTGVGAGLDRLLWLKLGMPTITTTEATQDIRITIDATTP